MSFQRKYFGTDGVRGRVGASLVNPEFVLKLGWAAGTILKRTKKECKVLIGKDTRISGYLLEAVLEAGFTSAGVHVHLLGPMPTPGIAYLTRTLRADAGIVISASHNPYYDNGIKFFGNDGTKISDAIEYAIEEQLEKPMQVVDAAELGKAKRVDDAVGRYVEFCKSTLGIKTRLGGMKIIVDCAHGATYHVAPSVLQELDATVTELGVNPDGFNINEHCGSTYPQTLAKIVVAEGADVGVAFDGDGDRVIMVDHKGEIVDGDELLFIMAKHYLENNILQGGVVGTSMSNFGLEQGFAKIGIDFKRAKVGDRYVLEALRNHNWFLGGESSGHIVNLGLTTTGDGIVSALQVLAIIYNTGRTLHELKSAMLKCPQVLLNVKIKEPVDLSKQEKVQIALRKVEKHLAERGRVLLRASGTEPLIRVMVEGEDAVLIKMLAEELADVVREVAS
jgi:phosphoglucosamine mutase